MVEYVILNIRPVQILLFTLVVIFPYIVSLDVRMKFVCVFVCLFGGLDFFEVFFGL